MRIVVLTHKFDRHYYFCNQIIERTGNVVGVVTGAKDVKRTRLERLSTHLSRKHFVYSVRNRLLNIAFKRYGRMLSDEKRAVEADFFGGQADHFHANHPHLLLSEVLPEHRSVNDAYYASLIRHTEPDVIVVMGTCIIGHQLMSSANCVLNLHTGLSPYYRGGHTNLFPIVDDDPGFFGVTIHVMSSGIDAGDIVFSQRPEITANDNYATINSKCIVLGTALMVQALGLADNRVVPAVKQWTKGKLFFNHDMNNYVAYQYFKSRDDFFARHVELTKFDRLRELTLVEAGVEHHD